MEEGGVAVGISSQVVPVDEDLGIHVDSFEVDGSQQVVGSAVQAECLAVPAGAGGIVAAVVPGGSQGVGCRLDAPVVGQVEGAPGAVVEVGAGSVGDIAQLEFPLFVEALFPAVIGPQALPGAEKGKQGYGQPGEEACPAVS